MVAVILFGGVFAGQYFAVQKNQQIKIVQPQTQTAGWKTYNGYEISFKYPESMGDPSVNQLSTRTEIGFGHMAVSFSIGMYYDQNLGRAKTFDEVVRDAENNPNAVNLLKQNIVVDGKNGVKISYTDKITGGGTIEIYVPTGDAHGNILMAYEYSRGAENEGLTAGIEEIFSTFKFTTPADQTAGWKTYANNTYGFEFKYPGDFQTFAYGKAAQWNVDVIDPSHNISINLTIDMSRSYENIQDYISQLDQAWQKSGQKYNTIDGGKVLINGYDTVEQQTPIGGIVPGTLVITSFMKNNNAWSFTIAPGYANKVGINETDIDLYHQILSTFKFTTPVGSTTDWTKYTNDQLMTMAYTDWKNQAMFFKGLEGNFLIIDQGTAPYPRGLIIYDLRSKKQVLSDRYSQPLDITSATVSYWNPTNQKVTAQN
ncbi:MAG: hypothetical protein NTY61_03810, partial [Candidatus Parcubacteria bacterium]|nr:hypothetical protein [Candidatus Parcubacteria bacterium]